MASKIPVKDSDESEREERAEKAEAGSTYSYVPSGDEGLNSSPKSTLDAISDLSFDEEIANILSSADSRRSGTGDSRSSSNNSKTPSKPRRSGDGHTTTPKKDRSYFSSPSRQRFSEDPPKSGYTSVLGSVGDVFGASSEPSSRPLSRFRSVLGRGSALSGGVSFPDSAEMSPYLPNAGAEQLMSRLSLDTSHNLQGNSGRRERRMSPSNIRMSPTARGRESVQFADEPQSTQPQDVDRQLARSPAAGSPTRLAWQPPRDEQQNLEVPTGSNSPSARKSSRRRYRHLDPIGLPLDTRPTQEPTKAASTPSSSAQPRATDQSEPQKSEAQQTKEKEQRDKSQHRLLVRRSTTKDEKKERHQQLEPINQPKIYEIPPSLVHQRRMNQFSNVQQSQMRQLNAHENMMLMAQPHPQYGRMNRPPTHLEPMRQQRRFQHPTPPRSMRPRPPPSHPDHRQIHPRMSLEEMQREVDIRQSEMQQLNMRRGVVQGPQMPQPPMHRARKHRSLINSEPMQQQPTELGANLIPPPNLLQEPIRRAPVPRFSPQSGQQQRPRMSSNPAPRQSPREQTALVHPPKKPSYSRGDQFKKRSPRK